MGYSLTPNSPRRLDALREALAARAAPTCAGARVPTRWPAIDEALGGGLPFAGLHEWWGALDDTRAVCVQLAWNALLAAQTNPTPFMRHEYLAALHASGSAVPGTGWTPSFLLLEQFGLLDVLFPDAAKALKTNRSGVLRAMLMQALRNTDERVRADKTVAPGFLFACLLWPAYCREVAVLQAAGAELAVAQQRAADRVTLHQTERVAIPRRFSLPMQEIWQLQARFGQRTRKRVFRLLAHPRFRAAFDFLALRAHGVPELAEELRFWEQAQALAPEQLAEIIPAHAPAGSAESAAQPPKRRRRRSRPRPAG